MPASICIVIGNLEEGGTEHHLARILPRLDRSSFRPEVVTLTGRGGCADILEAGGVKVRSPANSAWSRLRHPILRAGLLAGRAVYLFFYFLIRRPDAAHFFLPAAYLIGAPLAIMAGIRPRLMSRRSLNTYQSNKPAFLAAIERVLHKRMDAVVGNSQAVVRQLVDDEGVAAQSCRLLYNGIEVAEATNARDASRAALGIYGDTVVLSIVANLIPYKGHADLLDACSRLTPDAPWRLLVIGNDSAGIEEALRQQARQSGLTERIVFLGRRADIPDLLAASDIAVLASHEEGFSNAILEAMAAGLPMVTTDVGGNAEAVENGETGLVVPARQPAAMASALQRLVDDPAMRRQMGAAGRQRVRDLFSLEACVANYEALYRSVLGDRPGSH